MNWSPGSSSAVGADQVAPPSTDWLTITSEFVVAVYGSLGAGVVLSRMSDQTTARWSGDRAVDPRRQDCALLAKPEVAVGDDGVAVPHAATCSLSSRSPTLVSLPLPAATRT